MKTSSSQTIAPVASLSLFLPSGILDYFTLVNHVIESSNADAIRVSADTLAYEYTAWAFINKSVPIFLISHILLNQFT